MDAVQEEQEEEARPAGRTSLDIRLATLRRETDVIADYAAQLSDADAQAIRPPVPFPTWKAGLHAYTRRSATFAE